MSSQTFQAGQTGLIVRVPEAEPAVRAWRERLDPSAHDGVPAHVTVLFPFLDESRLDADVIAALTGIVAGHRAFDLRFRECGRLPEVLYLVPEPAAPLRALTEAVAARWPEAPPYGGRFTEIIPHLTIAQGQDEAAADEIEAGLLGRLPIASRVSSVVLMAHDGTAWRERAVFPLGRREAAPPGRPDSVPAETT
ncbi:2'-5' RNA ligase family protein [Streptomyces sp. NPDC058612]|uniref:2'-5' RNA ligase family protein n=1 Tax=Streptomyces sp. NPDC058612 TaxID=3346555 RepID=UPI0036502E4A